MKKIKSRKGFTLIELVVTVAILSIVLGLGTGVFIMVIRNYGTASSYEQEQEKATQIENYLVREARTATGIKLIETGTEDKESSDSCHETKTTLPSDQGSYIFCEDGSDVVQLYEYKVFDDTSGTTSTSGPEKNSIISVSGVKQMKVSLKRQKMNNEAAKIGSKENFIYLDYTIEMVAGYTLRGSVVMNNLEENPKKMLSMPDTNVDLIDSITVCDYNEDSTPDTSSYKAILFIG